MVGADDSGSLWWLWQIVCATCFWAISDVICDACIAPTATSVVDDEEESEPVKEPVEETAEEPAESVRATVRKRPKPLHDDVVVNGDALKLSNQTPTGQARSPPPVAQRGKKTIKSTSHSMDGLSQVPIVLSSPARGRVRSGSQEDFADVPKKNPPAVAKKVVGQLTAEQNALVSGCISIFVASVLSASDLTPNIGAYHVDPPQPAGFSSTDVLAAIGGCIHFVSYLSTLLAFGSASSTVITPLMQLSALWMLLFSTCAAVLGIGSFIRLEHLLSVVLVCVGGFLPAAGGSLSSILTCRFWKQSAVRYVMLGEFLNCCYNFILHQSTFGNGEAGSTLRFFLISRAANGLACVCLFLTLPPLRRHTFAMNNVSPRYLALCVVGESLSVLGVCLVTFSYSSFCEPSVVNAVEGGLQQLFNLLFAILWHRALDSGRVVDQVFVKFGSFALVATGLAFSTL